MIQKNKSDVLFLSALTDLLINVLVSIICCLIEFDGQLDDLDRKGFMFALVLVVLSVLIYITFDIYSVKRVKKLSLIIRDLICSQSLFFAFSVLLLLVFYGEISSGIYLIIDGCVMSLVLLSIKKSVSFKILHYMRKHNKNSKKILIVGDGYGAIDLSEQLNDNLHFGYRIIGCVCNSDKTKAFVKLGNYEDLDRILKDNQPNEVVISLNVAEEKMLPVIMNICDNNGIRAGIIPRSYKYFRSKCQVDMVGTVPLINTRDIPLDSLSNSFLKRTLDLILSVILIILTFPIMVFAFIGVKLTSKGPAIFVQKRVGKNNREFNMYKFRSMVVNNESDIAWTVDTDPRKTKFGNFMRKTGIDELPQLFNVLIGNMSIVGPRPELPKYVNEFSKEIPLYRVKHQVKPGITGLAQIYGYRGNTSIEKRIDLDIRYIENWSFISDLKIIAITPFKMINRNEKYTG